ncbi:hypothetical protein ACS0TY_023830 [Phlomoides rotata]
MLREGVESSNGAEDVSVDILEFSRSRELKVKAKEDPDATENSSSFDDTVSGNENTSGLSDVEVESQFFGDSDLAPPFDGIGSVFPMRKKKLTAHWRNFIRPLMWRCKWTEINIKKLDSQASKYVREIEIMHRGKHMVLDQTVIEQSGSKLLPFTHQSRRKQPMKRRKRRRVEDTTDIASFMSQHVLFAERDIKRSDLDVVPTFENLGSSGQHTTSHDEFEFKDSCVFPDDDDNFLEHVLRKIELVHTRVHKLKAQLDSIMIKNAAKFSSSENLCQLVAGDVQTSSPMLSACNGDSLSLGDFIGDFIIPDTADSFGGGISIPPDIIESTVGLLSSIDVTQHNAQVGDSSEKIVDNIPIHNEAAEAECSTLKQNHKQSAVKTEGAEHTGDEESNKAVMLAVEPVANQAILKSCLYSEINFPTNKRKRGERKAGSGNWGRHDHLDH